MLKLVILIVCCWAVFAAPSAQVNTTEEMCVNDLIYMCEAFTFPQQDAGQFTDIFIYSNGHLHFKEKCTVDYKGINCTHRGVSTFSCSSAGVVIVNGQTLYLNSTTGADDIFCLVVDYMLHVFGVQRLTSNETVVEDAVQNFVQRNVDFVEKIINLATDHGPGMNASGSTMVDFNSGNSTELPSSNTSIIMM